jgi:hypothetical protein
VPLSEILADETFIMFGPHVDKQLIHAEEGFMAELDVSELSLRQARWPTPHMG